MIEHNLEVLENAYSYIASGNPDAYGLDAVLCKCRVAMNAERGRHDYFGVLLVLARNRTYTISVLLP